MASLMSEELEEHEIEDRCAEEHPPEDGVRAGEGAVGEGQDGDDHEEGHHRQEPNHQVRVVRECPVADEGGGRQRRDAGEEERDGPRLVEHLHRYPLHGALVDLDEVLVAFSLL